MTTPSEPKLASGKPPLSIAAVLPGPKNGMTIMTQRIVDELSVAYDVRLFDIGKSFQVVGLRWSFQKAVRSIASVMRIVTWRQRDREKLYLVFNATAGLYYNLLQVLAARIRGFPVVAHHHVWSYLSEHDWKMSCIIRLMGDSGIHVVACPEMATNFERTYSTRPKFAYVTPGIVGIDPGLVPAGSHKNFTSSNRPFVIGMLSNLTLEKGVEDAIQTLESLIERGRNARLILAGPITTPEADSYVQEAKAGLGDRLVHLGPVYGVDKIDFFREIDGFVFPTRYLNESWGIVLNEALMAGVPAITFRRGCTGYLIGKQGGLVIEQDHCFANLAADQIEQWMAQPETYNAAVASAKTRGSELGAQAEAQLARLISGFQDDRWPSSDDRNSQHFGNPT